ncbi:MAG: peptidoglycan-binding protein [Clostridia bacterium]|nr:peptidoglycan-binding protein [Clostridia bacterium]
MKKTIGMLILLCAVLFAAAVQADTCRSAQDHDYGEWQTVVEPGCIESGRREAVCRICGYAKKEMLAVLGHDWGELTVTREPTCVKTGEAERVCLRCGSAKQTQIGKIDHSWGEWYVLSEPVGKQKGTRESACTVCAAKRQEGFYQQGTLYEGMEPCEEVVRLQVMLSDLGFYKGSISGGQYGELTTSSVAHFQRHIHLEDSGVADWQTQAALKIAWEKTTGKTYADMQLPETTEITETTKETDE